MFMRFIVTIIIFIGISPLLVLAPGCPLIQNITNGDVIRSHTGSVIEVTCHNGMTIQGEALLICDGRNWSSSIPKCLEPSEVDSCDFESSQFCGWSQDQMDDFDWTHHSGQTSTGRTGPNTDHTLGPNYTTGHYIYMEASTPRHPGDVARLLSPWYPSDRSNRCFRFWYHMNGPNQLNAVGTLKILLRTGSGKNFSEKILFTMSGNQGEDWKCGHFKIPICSERFQIVLEAIRQDSYASDIAVDDWLMFPCTPPDLSLPDPAAQSARQSTISEGISSGSSHDTTEGVDISTRMFTMPPTVKNTTETFTKDDTSSIMTTVENSVTITSTYVSDSSSTSEQSYHTELFKTTEDNHTSSTSASILSNYSSTENLNRKSKFASIVTTVPEVPLSTSTNNLTKPPETSQTDKYANLTNNESNINTFSKEPSSTTRRSLLHNSTHKNHLIVFTAEAIVNMCIGLVVLCLFTVILVIMGCICRRQQKIYNDKYQELKLFVETHYRTKYITV